MMHILKEQLTTSLLQNSKSSYFIQLQNSNSSYNIHLLGINFKVV